MPGGWIELSGPTDDRLQLTCSLERLSDLGELVPLLRRVADLDADLAPIEEHLAADDVLAARLATTPIQRLPGAFDRFEVAVRAIVGQQVSVAAARTLLGRLVAMTAPVADSGQPSIERFPTAETLASCSLDGLGMPARRRATITTLARAVADGTVRLEPNADVAETTAALEALDGIGPWTAGYIAMRALSDPDGWPPNDLALRRSLGIGRAELEPRAERWRPWRAYAALLLWHSDPTQETNPRPSTANGAIR